jgi:hypothetical protein
MKQIKAYSSSLFKELINKINIFCKCSNKLLENTFENSSLMTNFKTCGNLILPFQTPFIKLEVGHMS